MPLRGPWGQCPGRPATQGVLNTWHFSPAAAKYPIGAEGHGPLHLPPLSPAQVTCRSGSSGGPTSSCCQDIRLENITQFHVGPAELPTAAPWRALPDPAHLTPESLSPLSLKPTSSWITTSGYPHRPFLPLELGRPGQIQDARLNVSFRFMMNERLAYVPHYTWDICKLETYLLFTKI